MLHTIEIRNFGYHPNPLIVSVGDDVKWVNRDAIRHSATRENTPQFDTGLLARDQESTPITFDEASPPGGHEYYCQPHPHMTAVIVVQKNGQMLFSGPHSS